MQEFPDVVPFDLPCVPLDRNIDFSSDTKPDTKPIYNAPYHRAPIELKEFKDQLQGLLHKELIRPCVSPWGAQYFCEEGQDYEEVY